MKKLLLSLSCTLALSLSANINLPITHDDFKVTLSWLEDKPKSYQKDFFIIQYLKQDVNYEDATAAYNMARNKNGRVKKAYNKKFNTLPKEDLKCYRAKTDDLFKFDDRCLALGLSIYDSTTLSKNKLDEAIKRVDAYPTLRNDLKVIAAPNSFEALKNTEANRFYRLFSKTGKDYRKNVINQVFPSDFINKISQDKKFNKFVRQVVTNPKLENLQKSLFEVKDNKSITHQSSFFLAINAIKHEKNDIALDYLNTAYKKAYFQMDKDKVNFWRLLVSKNRDYLDDLSTSWDNNIYSLYIKEILKIEPDNIEYDIKQLNTKSSYDTLDSFAWNDVLKDTRKNLDDEKFDKYYNLFSDKDTLPHLAYVMERYKRYKTQYFITPFDDIFSQYDTNKQVLMYAIGRQESRFIPSSISFATAQGIMQIMPFLSKDLAKKMNEEYNVYHQFIPEVNIKYASKHLNSLKKQFDDNPLFIAYAYNGGAGFTRRQFKNNLFSQNRDKNRFEPFLSMELIQLDETRRYGKKVLANYYIYNNHLNKENSITLSSIFQNLTAPKVD